MYLNNFYEIQGKCLRRAADNPLNIYCGIEGLNPREIYLRHQYEKQPAVKAVSSNYNLFKIIATALILAIIV